MNQIDEIKMLQRSGYGPLEISRRLGINRKTAHRYMQRESFEPEEPQPRTNVSKLDPWKPEIEQWIDEDRRMRFKQRHTARRVFSRLKELHPDFDCSYTIVQRYLKTIKANRRNREGSLTASLACW